MKLVDESGQEIDIGAPPKQEFIYEVRERRTQSGKLVREIVAVAGERPASLARFYGILIGAQTDQAGRPIRQVEVEFPIDAMTIESAFDQFEELAKRKAAEMEQRVVPVDAGALKRMAGPQSFRPVS